MRSLSAPGTVTGDEFWWETGRFGDTRALACAWMSLVVNDHRVLLQGSSGLYPAKVVEDASHRGRKALRWCFKANNIAEMTSHRAVGWQEIMSLEILIDLECSFTLDDEIYTYQIFFVFIHTVWMWVKARSYFRFYLHLQLFGLLLPLFLSESVCSLTMFELNIILYSAKYCQEGSRVHPALSDKIFNLLVV